ncbi:unnamed protein product, partial [Mesorhabditis spiculigera]
MAPRAGSAILLIAAVFLFSFGEPAPPPSMRERFRPVEKPVDGLRIGDERPAPREVRQVEVKSTASTPKVEDSATSYQSPLEKGFGRLWWWYVAALFLVVNLCLCDVGLCLLKWHRKKMRHEIEGKFSNDPRGAVVEDEEFSDAITYIYHIMPYAEMQ